MPRVVVPYRPGMLFRRTYEAARAWGGDVEFVNVRNRNEPADGRPTYCELLADLWASGGSFIMLEHDVVPYEGAIQAIAECPEPWCSHGYHPAGGIADFFANLGCTKVSSQVIAATRDVFRKPQPWNVLDAYLSAAACAAGYRVHRHAPDIQHHPLGDGFIDLDQDGEPIGEPREPYKPLRARGELTSHYMGGGRGYRKPDLMWKTAVLTWVANFAEMNAVQAAQRGDQLTRTFRDAVRRG